MPRIIMAPPEDLLVIPRQDMAEQVRALFDTLTALTGSPLNALDILRQTRPSGSNPHHALATNTASAMAEVANDHPQPHPTDNPGAIRQFVGGHATRSILMGQDGLFYVGRRAPGSVVRATTVHEV